jgi:diguanylate cyclase (GGDEF)-like protein/PAS domain S-box-containing protein
MEPYNIDYKKIFELQEGITIITDLDEKKIVYGNKAFIDFFHLRLENFIKEYRCICDTFEKYEENDYLTTYIEEVYWIDYILRNPNKNFKALIKNSNGYFFHFQIILKIFDKNKYLISFKDITEEIQNNKEINLLKQYKNIVDTSYIVSKTNKEGIITFANSEFCEISGYSKEELIGQKHSIIKSELNDYKVYKTMWETISSGNTWKGTVINKNKKGSIYIVDSIIKPILKNNEIIEYISIRKDITEEYFLKEELKKKNKELKQLSLIDSLTELYNRRGIEEKFHKELSLHFINNQDISVVMIDIDNFKNINDTYGHDIGDFVINEISNILQKNIKKADYVARFGGEEFMLLLPNTYKKDAAKLSDNLRKIIEKYKFSRLDKQITASFGVTSLKDIEKFKTIEDCIISLTKKADIRLYEAKKQGRNLVVCGDYRNFSESKN